MRHLPSLPARPHPHKARLAYGVLALPLVLSPVALAAPGDSASAPIAAPASEWSVPADGDDGGSEDVTLITGDTVHVTTAPDGTQTIAVSARPEGGSGFLTHEDGGD